jgi:hypothetical protein
MAFLWGLGDGGRTLLDGTGGCSVLFEGGCARLGTGAFIGGDCMLRTEQTTSGFDAQSHRTYTDACVACIGKPWQ